MANCAKAIVSNKSIVEFLKFITCFIGLFDEVQMPPLCEECSDCVSLCKKVREGLNLQDAMAVDTNTIAKYRRVHEHFFAISRMKLLSPQFMGLFWGFSELSLSLWKRAKSDAAVKDRHSLSLIWVVCLSAVALGISAAHQLRSCRMPSPDTVLQIGTVIFLCGLILRWYSIFYLGRFFTVNVAIAKDHQLIDSGPYRYIRHPSYTGSLMALLGYSTSLENWASLLIVFVPCCIVTLWRIHVEEQALLSGLGEKHQSYLNRTKRLIPLVY